MTSPAQKAAGEIYANSSLKRWDVDGVDQLELIIQQAIAQALESERERYRKLAGEWRQITNVSKYGLGDGVSDNYKAYMKCASELEAILGDK